MPDQSVVTIKQLDGLAIHYYDHYKKLESEFFQIGELFEGSQDYLHDDRNVIKEVKFDSSTFVVKSFKSPSFVSRVIYTFFRSSKALRSFEYSSQLRRHNISVPEPIACIRKFQQGLLGKSYYVSERFAADCTLHEVLRSQMFSQQEVLPEVARLAYSMHEKGFLHLDFSPGNILIKKIDDEFKLALVDVNRMRFGKVEFEEGIQNFVRIIVREEDISILANAYAKLADRDSEKTTILLKEHYEKYQRDTRFLQFLKAPFKKLFKKT